jgi:hypothetical protein
VHIEAIADATRLAAMVCNDTGCRWDDAPEINAHMEMLRAKVMGFLGFPEGTPQATSSGRP